MPAVVAAASASPIKNEYSFYCFCRSRVFFKFGHATLCMSTVFAVVRCPSVRLSRWWIVSRRLKKSSDFLFDPVGPSLYSFLDPCAHTKFQGESRQRGRIIHRGRKIGDFRLKSPFISETVRNRPMHGYYGTLIGSHMWRIDPCRFRCQRVTFDPDFKVTAFFEVRGYYAGRIERCGLPSVTLYAEWLPAQDHTQRQR